MEMRSRIRDSSSTTRISAMYATPRIDADLETGLAGPAGDRDLASMQGHDPLDDGQAQSCALFLGGEKRVEDLGLDVLGDALAVVDHGHPQEILLVEIGLDGDGALPVDGLDGVEDEVQEH